MHQLFFPNGFEKTKVRWEKIKIKLAHNVLRLGEVAEIEAQVFGLALHFN